MKGVASRAKKAVIVLPTYNEAQNVRPLVSQILGLHPAFNIIVIDDNSPDGTGKIADYLASKDTRITVVHRPKKMGLGSACVEGFKKALSDGADLIFEMDADFSHSPYYLGALLAQSETTDVVIGSRHVKGASVEGSRFRRLLLSKLANMYVSCVTARPLWDSTTGLRCYNRQVLEIIDLDKIRSDGYAFQIEMLALAFRHGFTVAEVPITFFETASGVSRISRKAAFEAFWLTLRHRASLPEIGKRLAFLLRNYELYRIH